MSYCLQELSEEIEDYTQRFNTEDQLEWNLVLQEVAAFVEVKKKTSFFFVVKRSRNCIFVLYAVRRLTGAGASHHLSKQADPVVVLNDNNAVVVTSNRLQEGSVPPLEQGMVVGQLVLADSLIIGNCNNQVLTH